jgi:hypothetical protein
MASEGPHKVPLQLLLEGGALQWLLGRDAAASLVVLESRSDLPADVVLQLLQGEGDSMQVVLFEACVHQVSRVRCSVFRGCLGSAVGSKPRAP